MTGHGTPACQMVMKIESVSCIHFVSSELVQNVVRDIAEKESVIQWRAAWSDTIAVSVMLVITAQQHSSGKIASFFLQPRATKASTRGLEAGIFGGGRCVWRQSPCARLTVRW